MDTDVVVVGASLAGCTAAACLGRAGARVVLVERAPGPNAYKVACTHSVQACAMPTLSRLGLLEEVEAAGAVPNAIHMRTPYGWIRPQGTAHDPLPLGFNLRRASLDPILRRAAVAAPNVMLEAGATVTDLLRDRTGRPTGVRARLSSGEDREVRARAVVAADGRDSTVARLARVPARIHDNARFGYFAQFRGVGLPKDASSTLWFGDPDMGYAFRNEDGVTVLAAMPHRRRLAEFKADPEGALMGYLRALPEGPDLTDVERVTPVIGRLRSPCTIRPAGRPGVGFVGDAAMASDPLWGVGCGFAFQSGEWLAQELAGPIARGEDEPQIDAALARYARRHSRALAGHQALMNDYASGRRFSPVERLLFSAASRDATTARHLHTLGSRLRPPQSVLPTALTRAAFVTATAPRARRTGGSSPGVRMRAPNRPVHHRVVRWLGHQKWFAASGRRFGARIDRALYRATNGRVGTTAGAIPVLLLTTTGRRSGLKRTTPVMYVRDGDRFIISSENFGEQHPAAWPVNLDACADAEVQVGATTLRCRARRLDEAEAARYWPQLVEAWPAHETYLSRSGRRHTFVLVPAEG